MRILVVAATAAEIAAFTAAARIERSSERSFRGQLAGHDIDVLVTGVGMVATAAASAAALAVGGYGLALNLGLCGTFDPAIPLGSVVHVVSDRLSELGAEDGDGFLSLEQLGLADPDASPFTGGAIVNATPPSNAVLAQLRMVRGITVNTVHGRDATIADARRRFDPDVESMEGAAFMYACAMRAVPYAQVRAVSNLVERRNREAWRIGPAIAAVSAAARQIVEAA